MFQTRLKTTFTLLFLVLTLAGFLLIGPIHLAKASTAPDFSLSANPTSIAVPRRGGASYDIHVQALNGFTGTINFTSTGRPNHGTTNFSPTASVTGTGDTTFEVGAGEDSPLGTFVLTVTGTSGSLQHSINVTLIISSSAPDFSLSISPLSQTISKGQTATYTLQVQYLNGLTETVNLTIDSGPTSDTLTLTPASFTGTGSAEFVVQTNSQSVLGTFTVTLIADTVGDESLDHRVQVNYTVVS